MKVLRFQGLTAQSQTCGQWNEPFDYILSGFTCGLLIQPFGKGAFGSVRIVSALRARVRTAALVELDRSAIPLRDPGGMLGMQPGEDAQAADRPALDEDAPVMQQRQERISDLTLLPGRGGQVSQRHRYVPAHHRDGIVLRVFQERREVSGNGFGMLAGNLLQRVRRVAADHIAGMSESTHQIGQQREVLAHKRSDFVCLSVCSQVTDGEPFEDRACMGSTLFHV